jgi:hypothetical protein
VKKVLYILVNSYQPPHNPIPQIIPKFNYRVKETKSVLGISITFKELVYRFTNATQITRNSYYNIFSCSPFESHYPYSSVMLLTCQHNAVPTLTPRHSTLNLSPQHFLKSSKIRISKPK